MKNFHLSTDTLRTTLTPFSPRLNDQSINQKDDRIIQIDVVALKWMIESLMKNFSSFDRYPPHHLNIFLISIERLINQRNPTENRANTELGWERGFISFSSRCSSDSDLERFHEHTPLRYDLPIAFLNRPSIQLNIHTTENCANIELGWEWGFMAFSLAAQPFQVRSSSINLRSSFKKRPSHSPSSIGRVSNWTYIRLRITRTLKWVEGEVFDVFPRTAQPIQVRSSSTNIRPPYSLSQLAEHPIEYTHD